MSIHPKYTLSMSEKANLRKHLETWRGKAFTEADFGPGGFNMAKLLGVNMYLDGSPTEQRIAEISVPAAAPSGIAYRVTLMPFVEDLSKVPDKFLIKTPNMQGIRAKHCQTWKEGMAVPVVAGVRFEIQRTAVSTGKAEF